MQELQVPTRPISIEIVTSLGKPVRGALFLPDLPAPRAGAKRVLELLNDERRFLPVIVGERQSKTVVSKQHIVCVQLDAEPAGLLHDAPEPGGEPWIAEAEAADWPTTPPSTECTLHLSDGEVLSGMLVIDSAWNASRLVDKLNRAASFVALITARGVAFANRDHIVQAE